MAFVIFCRKCFVGYGSVGEIPALCPSCLVETSWTIHRPEPPGWPFPLTGDDKRFLREMRIAADVPSPE